MPHSLSKVLKEVTTSACQMHAAGSICYINGQSPIADRESDAAGVDAVGELEVGATDRDRREEGGGAAAWWVLLSIESLFCV